MATQRYTITAGQETQDIVQAAGSAIATDTVQLNLDVTTMSKGDVVIAMNQLTERILEGPWPPA